jgi:hypothetical protein
MLDRYTVIETNAYLRTAGAFWEDEERDEFVEFISTNPEAGSVITGSGGLRKVRWAASGRGKRGGARVITYAQLDDGEIWLLIGYTKGKFDNLPTKFLVALRKEIDDAKRSKRS